MPLGSEKGRLGMGGVVGCSVNLIVKCIQVTTVERRYRLLMFIVVCIVEITQSLSLMPNLEAYSGLIIIQRTLVGDWPALLICTCQTLEIS